MQKEGRGEAINTTIKKKKKNQINVTGKKKRKRKREKATLAFISFKMAGAPHATLKSE